jgi:hypothetical protein
MGTAMTAGVAALSRGATGSGVAVGKAVGVACRRVGDVVGEGVEGDVIVGASVGGGDVGVSVGCDVSLGAHPAKTPAATILRKCRRDRERFLGLFPQYVLFIAVFLSGLEIQRYVVVHRIPDLRETSNTRQISCKLSRDVLSVRMVAIRVATDDIERRRARGRAN